MAQLVLSDETYRIGWDFKGFKKEDIGEKEFNDLTERFLKIYNEWAQFSREADVFDQLNQEYSKWSNIFEHRKNFNNESLGKYSYACFMCFSLNNVLMDMMHTWKCFKDDKLIPYFELDGNIPDFRCNIKGKPDWSIGFYLVPVKEES